MASFNNAIQKCSICSRIIRDKQKFIECLTCGRRFHAVPSCVKSFDTNVIAKRSINTCQNCLDDIKYSNETLASLNIFQNFVLFSYVMALFKAVVWALIFLTKLRFPPGVAIYCYCLDDSLPFQKLDDFDYEFTVLKGNNVNDRDMDRLSRLKFNPFDAHSNIALTSNNENLNYSTKINCEYYLPNDFSCLMKTANIANDNIFSITHLNIRSLNNKLNSLKQLLNSLYLPFQIIGLTETWLNDTNDDIFELDNYDFVNANRTSRNGGGVGIYITKDMNFKLRRDLNINDENIMASTFVEIITPNKTNIVIGVIYRPPNSKFDLFENEINQILSK